MEAPSSSKPSKSKSGKKSSSTKKSGVRTKFLIESLRNDYYSLREENDRLRELVSNSLPEDTAKAVLADCFDPNAPRAKVENIDELAGKMAGSNLDGDDDDEEDDAVGF